MAGNPSIDGLRIYTQNVYVGGDTEPLLSLDFSDTAAVVGATRAFWSQALASDVDARAEAWARRIERHRPHLVNLQEVFDLVEMELAKGTWKITRRLDLLAALEKALVRRRLPYEVVAVQANTSTGNDVGLPLAVGPGGMTRSLRFTDRIAVLRRTDVAVTEVASGLFAATHRAGPVTLTRGWIRVRTEVAGVPAHVANTHLEVQALAPVQGAQADELIDEILAGLTGTVIVAGDLNSDPANPGGRSWTPTYERFLAAGFTDAWLQSRPPSGEAGLTCCETKDLRNEAFDMRERIDFVLHRTSGADGAPTIAPQLLRFEILADSDVVGPETDIRWASDHAGLVVDLGRSHPNRH